DRLPDHRRRHPGGGAEAGRVPRRRSDVPVRRVHRRGDPCRHRRPRGGRGPRLRRGGRDAGAGCGGGPPDGRPDDRRDRRRHPPRLVLLGALRGEHRDHLLGNPAGAGRGPGAGRPWADRLADDRVPAQPGDRGVRSGEGRRSRRPRRRDPRRSDVSTWARDPAAGPAPYRSGGTVAARYRATVTRTSPTANTTVIDGDSGQRRRRKPTTSPLDTISWSRSRFQYASATATATTAPITTTGSRLS